jgi:hypothetical protein
LPCGYSITSFALAGLLCLRKHRLCVHAVAWLREISGANLRHYATRRNRPAIAAIAMPAAGNFGAGGAAIRRKVGRVEKPGRVEKHCHA